MTRRENGFTLLEMMVSLAILGLVVMALTDMLIRQNRTYTVVDQVTEAQQNLRAISDLLESEIRVTGLLVPEGGVICAVDRNNASDILVVTDTDAIAPANQTQNDLGLLVPNYGGGGGDNLQLDALVGGTGGTLDNVAFYDNTGDGNPDSDLLDIPVLNQTGGLIITDRNNPGRGTACGLIQAGSVGPGGFAPNGAPRYLATVDYTFGVAANQHPGLRPLAAGDNPPEVVAVPGHVYQINANNQLVRNGIPIADDVEDMQVAFFIDADGNGLVGPTPAGTAPPSQGFQDPIEYPGSTPGALYSGQGTDHSDLREVRVSMVVRSRTQDAEVQSGAVGGHSAFIVTENRINPALPPDGFHRRLHRITIRPRNVGRR